MMGAGGHAREVRDIAEESARRPALVVTAFHVEPGFLPDAKDHGLLRADVVEGPPAAVGRGGRYVAAVGDPRLRARLSALAETAGLSPLTIVSNHSRVVDVIPEHYGVVVFPLTFVSSNTFIGPHTHINAGCVVSHDAVLGEYVTVGPGCRIAGNATVGPYAVLGAGCVILPGRSVGAGAIVGAGAVITRDVAEGVVVAGVPAVAVAGSAKD